MSTRDIDCAHIRGRPRDAMVISLRYAPDSRLVATTATSLPGDVATAVRDAHDLAHIADARHAHHA